MDFRIADTFADSLARLTGNEPKAVKTPTFDLHPNPVTHPKTGAVQLVEIRETVKEIVVPIHRKRHAEDHCLWAAGTV